MTKIPPKETIKLAGGCVPDDRQRPKPKCTECNEVLTDLSAVKATGGGPKAMPSLRKCKRCLEKLAQRIARKRSVGQRIESAERLYRSYESREGKIRSAIALANDPVANPRPR